MIAIQIIEDSIVPKIFNYLNENVSKGAPSNVIAQHYDWFINSNPSVIGSSWCVQRINRQLYIQVDPTFHEAVIVIKYGGRKVR